MRKGPRPLSVQIGMAVSGWPHAFPQQNFPRQELPQELEKMLLGIRLYQNHEYQPEKLPIEKIWAQGTASLNAIPGYGAGRDRPAIVLVPSLINKANILDLMAERSLMRFMAAQKITPYLLDWGNIIDDPGQQDMEGIITERLIPALRFAAEREGGAVHALGYCMGGTLLMGAAVSAPEVLASIVMLAAPWDFHGGAQALLNRVKFWAPSAFPLIEEKGLLPVDWIQVVFASLDPFMAANKFAGFSDMQQDSDRAKLFVAVEDWLNDGIDLPSRVAQHCIKEWFFENRPGRGEWVIGNRTVAPETIGCPALIVASERDRLVEFDTAAALHRSMKNTTLLKPDCGHIGMIAGGQSQEKVWAPIAAWLQQGL